MGTPPNLADGAVMNFAVGGWGGRYAAAGWMFVGR
jgi:hypothetical protein